MTGRQHLRCRRKGETMRANFWVAAAVCGLAGLAHGAEPAGDIGRGKNVYIDQMCHNCHGTVGQGGGVAGPRIAPNPFPWVAFAQQVRKPRQLMPPYSAKTLPDQDLADIYAYVRSIKAGPAAKDIPLLNQ
jgi:mono/diheme cytochrome c family protein